MKQIMDLPGGMLEGGEAALERASPAGCTSVTSRPCDDSSGSNDVTCGSTDVKGKAMVSLLHSRRIKMLNNAAALQTITVIHYERCR